jgi:hypothetical protein
MLTFSRVICAAIGLGLAACDVQIGDETPQEYPARHDIGMYEIKASADSGAMVTPSSVHLMARIGDQTVELTPNRARTQWTALYSARCRSSFPIQFLGRWSIQGLTTRGKLEPRQPREVRLIEPPLTGEVKVDTSQKAPKGWAGSVQYRFVTAPAVRINDARIEPLSQDPADVKAAEAIAITTSMPVEAMCGTPTDIQLLSKAQTARGTLVIETDHPAVPKWQTKVEFAPAPAQGGS